MKLVASLYTRAPRLQNAAELWADVQLAEWLPCSDSCNWWNFICSHGLLAGAAAIFQIQLAIFFGVIKVTQAATKCKPTMGRLLYTL